MPEVIGATLRPRPLSTADVEHMTVYRTPAGAAALWSRAATIAPATARETGQLSCAAEVCACAIEACAEPGLAPIRPAGARASR